MIMIRFIANTLLLEAIHLGAVCRLVAPVSISILCLVQADVHHSQKQILQPPRAPLPPPLWIRPFSPAIPTGG